MFILAAKIGFSLYAHQLRPDFSLLSQNREASRMDFSLLSQNKKVDSRVLLWLIETRKRMQ